MTVDSSNDGLGQPTQRESTFRRDTDLSDTVGWGCKRSSRSAPEQNTEPAFRKNNYTYLKIVFNLIKRALKLPEQADGECVSIMGRIERYRHNWSATGDPYSSLIVVAVHERRR